MTFQRHFPFVGTRSDALAKAEADFDAVEADLARARLLVDTKAIAHLLPRLRAANHAVMALQLAEGREG